MEREFSLQEKDEGSVHLRILYLYQMLISQSDEEHPLTTNMIIDQMEKQHHIYVHRTTVASDIAMLKEAGIDIISERHHSMNYYLGDRLFSVPELKLLIDAVQSSRFITEKKSEELIEKLTSLTSHANAHVLKRKVQITGRIKSENEKGYYIIDAINEAINKKVKIAFYYYEYNVDKERILKNDGVPYIVSPYDLIWDGDYYYMTGYCDQYQEVRIFRVDRIDKSPVLLDECAMPVISDYNIKRYMQEVFRMYDTDEVVEVRLLCNNEIMKFVIDQFGIEVPVQKTEEGAFIATVKVCPSPTFYRWIFGFSTKIRILNPQRVREEYRQMLIEVLEGQ